MMKRTLLFGVLSVFLMLVSLSFVSAYDHYGDYDGYDDYYRYGHDYYYGGGYKLPRYQYVSPSYYVSYPRPRSYELYDYGRPGYYPRHSFVGYTPTYRVKTYYYPSNYYRYNTVTRDRYYSPYY